MISSSVAVGSNNCVQKRPKVVGKFLRGLIKAPLPLDLVYTNRFVKEANASDHQNIAEAAKNCQHKFKS